MGPEDHRLMSNKPQTGSTLYLVMPAYNEEESIRDVINSWYPVLDVCGPESCLVVADSGSTDHTHQILVEMAESLSKLVILSDTGKQHGPKLIALYRFAIEHGADYIFQTDSDGQTNPSEFYSFWKARHRYDAVLGYRPQRGDGASRAFVEKVVCLLLKLYFGVKVPDANAPFRLMKCDLTAKYIGRLPEDYFLPNIMLTAWFAYYHENIAFKKITFEPRRGGKGSLNIPRIVKIGWNALGDFRRFKKDMKS